MADSSFVLVFRDEQSIWLNLAQIVTAKAAPDATDDDRAWLLCMSDGSTFRLEGEEFDVVRDLLNPQPVLNLQSGKTTAKRGSRLQSSGDGEKKVDGPSRIRPLTNRRNTLNKRS